MATDENIDVDNLKNINVLVVDDNKINREILQKQLSEVGAYCMVSNGAGDALDKIAKARRQQTHFNIIMIDDQMPQISGDELARQITKDNNNQQSNLVMLSFSSGMQITAMQEAGFVGQVLKPIRSVLMLQILSQILLKAGQGQKNFFITAEDLMHKSLIVDDNTKFNNVTVLVAEDNRVNQEFISQMLHSLGCELFIASNGRQALEILQQNASNINIVFMDVNMPEIDGLQATREIKLLQSGGQIKDVPIIALTSADIEDEKSRCLEAGMVDFVSKPLRKQALQNLLAKYLPQHVNVPMVNANLLKELTILLVEDNRVNREFAIEILESFGLKVTVAGNGKEAVAKFQAQKFDFILMDCQMPVMDGYEATREIRKYEQTSGAKATPIIALTANAMKGDDEKCKASGMDDYITKPVRRDYLKKVLEKWV